MDTVILPVLGEALPMVALIALVIVFRWGFDRGVDLFQRYSQCEGRRRDRW